jgi:hypothetical protein
MMSDNHGGRPGEISVFISGQYPLQKYRRQHLVAMSELLAIVDHILKPEAALAEVVERHS